MSRRAVTGPPPRVPVCKRTRTVATGHRVAGVIDVKLFTVLIFILLFFIVIVIVVSVVVVIIIAAFLSSVVAMFREHRPSRRVLVLIGAVVGVWLAAFLDDDKRFLALSLVPLQRTRYA